jgi:hypothetical protein
LLTLLLLVHPRARAAFRLASGFQSLENESRVFYEPGAESYATKIAYALPGAIDRVEKSHSLPFKSEFRVYVCSTHESFTKHIGIPADSPVRGTALPWDVWVSPNALCFYGRDTHRQTLAHELSHLHLGQHLGWFNRVKNVPVWFSEGLADWVADTGHEIVSRAEAMEGFRSGHHLIPDASGNLPLPRQPRDYGLTWPLFHMQSRMFVEYLVERDEGSFKHLVMSVLSGVLFDAAFKDNFDDSLEGVWQDFVDSLDNQFEDVTGTRYDGGT